MQEKLAAISEIYSKMAKTRVFDPPKSILKPLKWIKKRLFKPNQQLNST